MVENAFKVLTEFRFDVAHAVAGSQTLQSEVGKISTAADQAHFALKRVGMGLVTQMSLGGGGLLGGIYSALKASDKFYQTQLKLTNIFQSNGLFQGANGFEQSMIASKNALQNMSDISKKFSLPANSFVEMASGIGAALIGHGLDDSSMSKSTDLTRAFGKSAQVLGIDPGMYQNNLLDMVMGSGSMGDRMTQRLFAETEAMKPFKGSTKGFNALEPAKRLEVLTKALDQFSSNSKVAAANALTMSSQIQRLSDNFTSIFSILKPLGDALIEPIKMILYQMNTYLEGSGRKVIENFSKIIKGMFADPANLFVNIQQARRLQGDVEKAGTLLGIISLVHGITWSLKYLGITLKGGMVGAGIRGLGVAMSWLGGWFMRLGGFSIVLRGLSFLLKGVLAPLAVFTFFFQVISRAMAKAQVSNAAFLAKNMERISEIMLKLKLAFDAIFLPIELALEQLSTWVAWFFELETTGNLALDALNWFADGLLWVGKVVVHVLSLISGVIGAMIGQVFNLMQGNFKGLFSGSEWGKMADEGYHQFWDKFNPENAMMKSEDRSVSTNAINIAKIEIQNSFKEQMEPDRIAFTLKEQLIKAATNPQQAVGRSQKANAI